jgi:serine O-acetyltransferase
VSERSSHWQLQSIVSQLRTARDQWRAQNGRASGEQGGRELPSRAAMAEILEALCGALFPMRLGPVDLREESEDFYVGHTLDVALNALLAQARLELRYAARHSAQVDTEVEARPSRSSRTSPSHCRGCAACWTPTFWPPITVTRRRAASMKYCCAIRGFWR